MHDTPPCQRGGWLRQDCHWLGFCWHKHGEDTQESLVPATEEGGATVGNCAAGIGERGGVDEREDGVGRWGEKKVWVVNERGKVVCWNEVDSS